MVSRGNGGAQQAPAFQRMTTLAPLRGEAARRTGPLYLAGDPAYRYLRDGPLVHLSPYGAPGTPGKSLAKAEVVQLGLTALSPGRLLMRETLVKPAPAVLFVVGLSWVGCGAREQGWHDKIAEAVSSAASGRASEASRKNSLSRKTRQEDRSCVQVRQIPRENLSEQAFRGASRSPRNVALTSGFGYNTRENAGCGKLSSFPRMHKKLK